MDRIAAGALSAFLFALIALGIVTAVWGIWMFFRQSRIVFRASRELLGDPSDVGLAFEDVYLRVSNGGRVHGWWIPGQGPGKSDLFFPGSLGKLQPQLT